MIGIREYPSGKLWTCPDLTVAEAKATVVYWRRLGIDCAVVRWA